MGMTPIDFTESLGEAQCCVLGGAAGLNLLLTRHDEHGSFGGRAPCGARTRREDAGELAGVERGGVERGLVAVRRAPQVRVLVVHPEAQVVCRLQEVLRRHARRRLRSKSGPFSLTHS